MIWFKAKITYIAIHILVWSLSGHQCIMTMPYQLQHFWFDGYEKGCYEIIMGGIENFTEDNLHKAEKLCNPLVAKTRKEFSETPPDYCEVK